MIAAIVALCLTAGLPTLHAPQLQAAIQLFDDGDLARARDALWAFLEKNPADPADEANARLYLAAAYHALSDDGSARLQLRELARRHPETRADPALFVPELVAMLEQARIEADHERASSTVPAVISAPAPASASATTMEALAPFGIGQRANGQRGKATFFLVSEAAAFAISAGALAWFELSKAPGSGGFLQGGAFSNPGQARFLDATYFTSFWLGVGLVAAGIIDAFLSRTPAATR